MAEKRRKKNTRRTAETWNRFKMFGPSVNFAVAEAYKLLRTNIMFSFSDEDQCHVIGVTSSVRGEGKSTTACNIAYVLSETGKKVLLIDADLRRPSIAEKLGLQWGAGMTNLLVSRRDYKDVLQRCAMAPKLDILVSGDIPPNPSELLGSKRMTRLMEELSQDYDYIIVDLPPVTVVTDALAISGLLHGVVMVVRDRVVQRRELAEAMRQLKLVNVRILGFVYRDSAESNRKYGSRYGKKRDEYYADYTSRPRIKVKNND